MTDEEESSGHLSAGALARLADQGGRRAAAQEIAHLARCPECTAAYAEVVVVRAQQLAGRPEEEVPDEWLAAGQSIDPRHTALKSPRPRRSERRWFPPQLWLPLASATVLALLVLATLQDRIPGRLQDTVRAAMRQNSQGTLLFAADVLPESRTERGAGQDLHPALRELAERVRQHPQSRESAYWLIGGLLAADRLEEADTFLRRALSQFGSDARFHNQAAILAFRRSDLQASETALRRALDSDRSAVVLVNLALTLQEQGKPDAARPFLEEVERRFGGTPLAAFARSQLTAP